MSGYSAHLIIAELVVEQNIISSADEQSAGGGFPSGSMTALCKMEKGRSCLEKNDWSNK